METLSVIIPVYNAEKYLRRCIESIVKQLDITDELILIEDGASDNSGAICDGYAERYPCVKVIHQLNGGVSSARNAGLRIAQGAYITFVDADDYVEKDMVVKIKQYIDRQLDFIFFEWNPTNFSGLTKRTNKSNSDIHIYDARAREEFIKSVFCAKSAAMGDHEYGMRNVWAKAYRRSFLLHNHIFFEEGVKNGEDMIYMLKVCSLFEKAGYVGKTIYYYFNNESSITNRYKPEYQNIVAAYASAIKPWLEVHPKYIPYYATDRLNDIILFIKYDFFHKENKEASSQLKKRMQEILREGNYSKYYELSKRSGLLRSYGPAKRFTFWLALHGRFTELKAIAKIRYS